MKKEELRELMELMREYDIAELEVEEDDRKVKIVASRAPQPGFYMAPPPAAASVPAPTAGAAAAVEPEDEEAEEESGNFIRSPIVGTFYSASSPDSPPFVAVGDDVDEETVLCIVEAMKVMNEIKAETRGRIIEILVENAHPVEFGQPLFRIAPPA